jgi:hypothetical protein
MAHILKAVVYSEGCPASNIVTKTYFTGGGNEFKYNLPVVSLVMDRDDLFDEESGIYVPGYHNNYLQHGKKWERPAHLEIYDTDQRLIIDQDAGVRIHGKSSRKAPQKSLRLYAGDEDADVYFTYPFFSQKPGLTRFKALLLRAEHSFSGSVFKDEMIHHLVQDMNIDYSASETAVLFLNGEYWGLYSLRETQDAQYVENNYPVTEPEIDIISYDFFSYEVEEGTEDSYIQLTAFLENAQPTDGGFLNEAERLIDLDALMDFYSAQIYLANLDFPNNNVEMWRLREDESRWRYFLFDMDAVMMRPNYDHLNVYFNDYHELERYPEYSTLILRRLLQNAEFRGRFHARLLYHLQHTFAAERVTEAINEFQERYAPLIADQIYRWNYPSDYIKWLHNVDMLREFAVQRPAYLINRLDELMGSPFVLFPNPARDHIHVELLFAGTGSIKLYNHMGILLNELALNPEVTKYFFSLDISPGLYFVKVSLNDLVYSEKLMVY